MRMPASRPPVVPRGRRCRPRIAPRGGARAAEPGGAWAGAGTGRNGTQASCEQVYGRVPTGNGPFWRQAEEFHDTRGWLPTCRLVSRRQSLWSGCPTTLVNRAFYLAVRPNRTFWAAASRGSGEGPVGP